MTKRRMIWICLGFIIVLVALIFYPVKNNVIYNPKIFDKSSSLKIEICYFNLFSMKIPYRSKIIEFYYDHKADSLTLQDNVYNLLYELKKESGAVNIVIRDKFKKYSFSIPVIRANYDSDNDGFPDSVELEDENDRTNFRKWFCTIALTQYYHPDDKWKDRDCAGFIRFCTREALKKHDNKWLAEKKLLYDINIPDVRKFNYPNLPLLGDKIFRIDPVHRDPNDSSEFIKSFSEFAEAKYLLSYNYDFISKDELDVLPGDILFFINDISLEWPYHSMIFLGSDILTEKHVGDLVIYHTGTENGKEGIIKKIGLSDLNKHPNKRWHPQKSNPFFLGFYRWKILK